MMMRAVPLLRRRGGWLQQGRENKACDHHHISSRSGQTAGHISNDDLLLLFASVCTDVAPLLEIFIIEMLCTYALRSTLGPV